MAMSDPNNGTSNQAQIDSRANLCYFFQTLGRERPAAERKAPLDAVITQKRIGIEIRQNGIIL